MHIQGINNIHLQMPENFNFKNTVRNMKYYLTIDAYNYCVLNTCTLYNIMILTVPIYPPLLTSVICLHTQLLWIIIYLESN